MFCSVLRFRFPLLFIHEEERIGNFPFQIHETSFHFNFSFFFYVGESDFYFYKKEQGKETLSPSFLSLSPPPSLSPHSLQPSPGRENDAYTRSCSLCPSRSSSSSSSSPPPPFLPTHSPPLSREETKEAKTERADEDGLAVRSASAKCLAETASAPRSPSSAASVAAERTSAARSAPVYLHFINYYYYYY